MVFDYCRFAHPLHRALWLVSTITLLPACGLVQDIDDQGGNSTRGYFNITPKGYVAEGSTLSLSIKDHETFGAGKSGVSLEDPRSSADDVAHVERFDGVGSLVVRGVKPGDAKLTFSARADGDRREDHYGLRVARLREMRLSTCGQRAVAVRGTDLAVDYLFNPYYAKPTLGLGVYPFTLDPSDGLVLDKDRSTLSSFMFHVPEDAADSVRITSSLPGDPSSLTVDMIDLDDIDGVADSSASPKAGGSATIDLRPRSQGRVVCVHLQRVIRSLTPNTCLIGEDTIDAEESFETFDQRATIQFVGAGLCRLALEFAGLDAPLPFKAVSVAKRPSSGSSGSHHHDWD